MKCKALKNRIPDLQYKSDKKVGNHASIQLLLYSPFIQVLCEDYQEFWENYTHFQSIPTKSIQP